MPILIQTLDTQADPRIAKHVADGEADAVVSGNSNFAMCICHNKDSFDLMIKGVHVIIKPRL